MWQRAISQFGPSIETPFSLGLVFPFPFFFAELLEPIRLRSFQFAFGILLISFCVLLHEVGPLAFVKFQALFAFKPIPTLVYRLLLLAFSGLRDPTLPSAFDALLQDASTLLVPYGVLIILDGVSLLSSVIEQFWLHFVDEYVPFGVHTPSFAQCLYAIWL